MAATDASDTVRVLLIEDDAEFAEMYRLRLEADEYTVEWAQDGDRGLELARAWEPDLIFLDIRLPGIGGIEVLRRLRADEATAAVPVVVLTNVNDEGPQREGERLGILDWRFKIDTTPGGIAEWVDRWSASLSEERRG